MPYPTDPPPNPETTDLDGPPDPAGLEDEESRRLHYTLMGLGYTYQAPEPRVYPRGLYRAVSHTLGLDAVAKGLTVERFQR